MVFILYIISFFSYSNNDIAVKKEIDLFLETSECLRNIPSNEITNPEHKVSQELSLITSVLENITLELGTNKNEQKGFRELYKVAYKYCPKEIIKLKAEHKSIAKKYNE